MNKTPYDKGLEEGREEGMEKGIEKGRRKAVLEMLEEQFGKLSPPVIAKVDLLPLERLRQLRRALLHANSLKELELED